jgi:hypothetical protein
MLERDPIRFAKVLWPQVSFYDKQREVIYAIAESKELYVPAGNMLGKDFLAGYVALSFMLNPVMYIPEIASNGTRRVVTTSVKDDHLRVLWGEIGRFITTSVRPLRWGEGGPLVVHHREIRRVVNGEIDKYSYLIGQVSEKGEGMSGHHAEYTMVIGDEASALDNQVYEASQGWAKRMLFIGNPNPSDAFFKRHIMAGDVLA